MVSKTGSLLVKIAAILTFIFAGIVFLVSILAFFGMNFIDINVRFPLGLLGGITFVVALIAFLFGFLYLKAADMMLSRKDEKTGAIIAIVLGVLTLGNVVGILGLVGGIIGLIESN